MVKHGAVPRNDRSDVPRWRAPVHGSRPAQQSDGLHGRCAAIQTARGDSVERAASSGIVQLHHMLGQLVAHGLNPKLEHLYARRAPRPASEKIKPKRMLALQTGIQPARLPADFHLPKKAVAETKPPERKTENSEPKTQHPEPIDARSAMMQAHLGTMQQLIQTQQNVMAAVSGGAPGRASRRRDGHPAALPVLPRGS